MFFILFKGKILKKKIFKKENFHCVVCDENEESIWAREQEKKGQLFSCNPD